MKVEPQKVLEREGREDKLGPGVAGYIFYNLKLCGDGSIDVENAQITNKAWES